MSKTTWIIKKEQNSKYLANILQFLLLEYSRIFGKNTMCNESCLVYNDPEANCPMLITNCIPTRIRLAQQSLHYWTQTIFQLSHELCHYAIRQMKLDKNFTLKWFEEIVCEAMSLYALKWSAEHWNECELSLFNPCFGSKIEAYLEAELQSSGNDTFQKCKTIKLLKCYIADANRESHKNERNRLYQEIIKDPLACSCFCDYQLYVDSNYITIDFEAWEKNDQNLMIKFLHSLQPCP